MDQERQTPLTDNRQVDPLPGWSPPSPLTIEAGDEEARRRSPLSDWAWPIGLFLATVFTTLWAGAYATNADPFLGAWRFLVNNPAALLKGIPPVRTPYEDPVPTRSEGTSVPAAGKPRPAGPGPIISPEPQPR